MSETKLPGMRQVPLPFVQTYDEEGNIVDLPPLPRVPLLMFNLIKREPAPGLVVTDWKPIRDPFAEKESAK